MLAIFVVVISLVCGQKYPEFFDNEDLKNLGFMSSHFNPNPVVHQPDIPKPPRNRFNKPPSPVPPPNQNYGHNMAGQPEFSYRERPPGLPPGPPRLMRGKPGSQPGRGGTRPNYDYDIVNKVAQKYIPKESKNVYKGLDEVYDFEEKVISVDKWDEFMEMLEEEKKENVHMTEKFQESFQRWNEWIDDIIEEKKQNGEIKAPFSPKTDQRLSSPGMEGYWGSQPKPKEESAMDTILRNRVEKAKQDNMPTTISGQQLLNMAIDRAKSIAKGNYYPPPLKPNANNQPPPTPKQYAPPPPEKKSQPSPQTDPRQAHVPATSQLPHISELVEALKPKGQFYERPPKRMMLNPQAQPQRKINDMYPDEAYQANPANGGVGYPDSADLQGNMRENHNPYQQGPGMMHVPQGSANGGPPMQSQTNPMYGGFGYPDSVDPQGNGPESVPGGNGWDNYEYQGYPDSADPRGNGIQNTLVNHYPDESPPAWYPPMDRSGGPQPKGPSITAGPPGYSQMGPGPNPYQQRPSMMGGPKGNMQMGNPQPQRPIGRQGNFANQDIEQIMTPLVTEPTHEMLSRIPPFARGSQGEQYWLQKVKQRNDPSWPSRAGDIPETVPRFMDQPERPAPVPEFVTKSPAPAIRVGPAEQDWQEKAIVVPQNSSSSNKYSISELLHHGPKKEKEEEEDDLRSLPVVDDLNSPIRWVKFNSNETEDGLAKVTDPRTGRNRQALIKGTVYVPVTDYNLERLGLTTRKPKEKPQMPAEEQASYRILMKNVDMDKIGERDWLAIEVAMGGRDDDSECRKEGCQSRCSKMGCESVCSGDTCAAGCIGDSCTAMCKGPGCLAMCIGEDCTAICDGLACDTRCRGKGCDAKCRKSSCHQTINGAYKSAGTGTFEQSYPQYDEANAGGPGANY